MKMTKEMGKTHNLHVSDGYDPNALTLTSHSPMVNRGVSLGSGALTTTTGGISDSRFGNGRRG